MLGSEILNIINENPEGVTMMGICYKLGFTGYDREVSNQLDIMKESDKIKSCPGWYDTVYYPSTSS